MPNREARGQEVRTDGPQGGDDGAMQPAEPLEPVPAASPVILETRDLSRRFGGFTAVDRVNLSIRAGEFHAIIGPNGAGKTTLFNLLSGDLQPTAGQILWKGADITRLPAHHRVHLGIGRSYQLTNLFPSLTALENVRLAVQARLNKATRGSPASLRLGFLPATRFAEVKERARAVLTEVGLAGREGVEARALSHGDQRKLEIAMLLACDPELLLLDEPTAGMSHDEVPEMLEVIGRLRRDGRRTVVLVEHKLDIVLNTSDRITVLHLGRVIASGTPEEIVRDETVQAAYLGGFNGWDQ